MYPKQAKLQHGFSLLEILVAFSILAMSLGVLLSIFSNGLRSAVIAEEYQEALAIAESQMARAGLEIDLAPGQISGVELDKYSWEMSISPFEFVPATQQKAQQPSSPQALPIDLNSFYILVSVSWQDGDDTREFAISSVRLATAQALIRK